MAGVFILMAVVLLPLLLIVVIVGRGTIAPVSVMAAVLLSALLLTEVQW